jgi:hypothetical protein
VGDTSRRRRCSPRTRRSDTPTRSAAWRTFAAFSTDVSRSGNGSVRRDIADLGSFSTALPPASPCCSSLTASWPRSRYPTTQPRSGIYRERSLPAPPGDPPPTPSAKPGRDCAFSWVRFPGVEEPTAHTIDLIEYHEILELVVDQKTQPGAAAMTPRPPRSRTRISHSLRRSPFPHTYRRREVPACGTCSTDPPGVTR